MNFSREETERFISIDWKDFRTSDRWSNMTEYAKRGSIKGIQFLRELGHEWDDSLTAHAVRNHHLDLLSWLRENGCPWNEWAVTWTVSEGDLELTKWLVDNGCPFDDTTLSHAINSSRLAILEYLVKTVLVRKPATLQRAVADFNLDTDRERLYMRQEDSQVRQELQRARDLRVLDETQRLNCRQRGRSLMELTEGVTIGNVLRRYESVTDKKSLVTRCCIEGLTDIVLFFHEMRFIRAGDSLINSAAAGGQLELVKWLRARGYSWTAWTVFHAAGNGHFPVVKWLVESGCPLDHGSITWAAKGGYLEIVQYLRSKGCEYNDWALIQPAGNGHLEVMKWMRADGCKLDGRIGIVAKDLGHQEMLKWFKEESSRS